MTPCKTVSFWFCSDKFVLCESCWTSMMSWNAVKLEALKKVHIDLQYWSEWRLQYWPAWTTSSDSIHNPVSLFFFFCIFQLMMKTLGPSSLIGGRLSITMLSINPYLSSFLFLLPPTAATAARPLAETSSASPSLSTGWDSWLVSCFIVNWKTLACVLYL